MKRIIKSLIDVILCCGLLLIVGCSTKEQQVSMEQLKTDLPEEVHSLNFIDRSVPLELKTVEVVKRSTEDIYDEIHCDLVLSSTEYRVNCRYVCEYKYYDQGGWSLMDYCLEDISVVCLSDIPAVMSSHMSETSVFFDREWYDVKGVECKKTGDTTYEVLYDVQLPEDYSMKYLHEEGVYRLQYSLVSLGGMSYSWKCVEDTSGVNATWDIEGTYVRKDKLIEIEIVIDYFNQNTLEAHIASYKYDSHYGLVSDHYDLQDITVTGKIYPEALLFSFPVEEGEYDWISFEKGKVMSSDYRLTSKAEEVKALLLGKWVLPTEEVEARYRPYVEFYENNTLKTCLPIEYQIDMENKEVVIDNHVERASLSIIEENGEIALQVDSDIFIKSGILPELTSDKNILLGKWILKDETEKTEWLPWIEFFEDNKAEYCLLSEYVFDINPYFVITEGWTGLHGITVIEENGKVTLGNGVLWEGCEDLVREEDV